MIPSLMSPLPLTTACLAAVAVLLLADWRNWNAGRVVAKIAASTLYVLVAVSLDATASTYGTLILAALLLGWLGDTLLLSRAPRAFMAGLAAFLLSHAVFVAAFASGASSIPAVAFAAAPLLVFGAVVLRWLLPHTPRNFRLPVIAYVVVILCMCATAVGHAFATQRWAVFAGALLFTASDLSVARDRFIHPSRLNRLWGWPTYFLAQIVFAWTVAAPA